MVLLAWNKSLAAVYITSCIRTVFLVTKKELRKFAYILGTFVWYCKSVCLDVCWVFACYISNADSSFDWWSRIPVWGAKFVWGVTHSNIFWSIHFVTLFCNRWKNVINSKIYWRGNIPLLMMQRLIKYVKLTCISSKTQKIGVMMPHPNFTQSNVSTSDLWCEPFSLNPNNFTRYTIPNGAQETRKDNVVMTSCISRWAPKNGLFLEISLAFLDLRLFGK